jgi:trigger factor
MATVTLTTSTERLGDNKVKLRVEVPEDALAGALSAAYRRWAKEIKVPGFRPGKVPRQLIDARVGREVVREEALRAALPELYERALAEEELEAIAPPELEVVAFEEGSPLVFEATVDLRPEVKLPDLAAIRIEAPPTEVTDDEVEEQLQRLRERFAELETVARPARRGDHVLIDLKGSRHGQPVEGASAPDYLYELGSGTGPLRLDAELEGRRAGEIVKFNDSPAGGGEEISFTVLIKEVKAKKLPPLDDELAKTAGEFDTLDELKEDLRARLAEIKAGLVEQEIRSRALDALVEASDLVPPDVLVEREFEHRLAHFEDELRRAGLTLDDYGRRVDLTELEIRRDIRAGAARSVKAELLLEELARREAIEVSLDELGAEITYLAARLGRKREELAEELAQTGRLGSIAADIMRRKALDLVVERIEVAGFPVSSGTGATGGGAAPGGKEEQAEEV